MKGSRVLDLSESLTGAYATRLLAGCGAEVIVGESRSGSPLRSGAPLLPSPTGPRSASWEYLGAYKRAALVEPDEVHEVAAGFDAIVLACDGGPSTARIAQQATRLRRLHPGLVVVTVTPFGLTGPYAAWRAGPLELWAAGGHLLLNGEPEREPIPGGGPWDSYLVGTTAAVAAQAALLEAADQGRGALVDVGAMEALASTHQWSISMYTHTGVIKRRAGNRLGEMHHPIALYPCRDGWVCIAAATFAQWEGLCIAADLVELLADDDLLGAADRFDRGDQVDEALTAWTTEHTVEEVVEAAQGQYCPAGPVADLSTILSDPQLSFRHYWADAPDLGPAALMPTVPFRLPSTPDFTVAPPPATEPITSVDEDATARRPAITADGGFAPLAGVRVVELTISWAGPLAGRFLADLGAEVIKVEHPTSRGVAVSVPDPDAVTGPWERGELPPPILRNGIYPEAEPGTEWWNRMSLWNKMNRSKRSLCLDIKAPGGRQVFDRLVATADIVLNNYSPRGVQSLGIDHETLRAIKPDVVTVAMSGFGATGPGADAVSWGPILDAASGLASTTGYADSGPYKQGVAYPDPVGGGHGAAAVLAAWWEHRRTGEAVHVDLSQLETLLAIAGDLIIEASVAGQAPPRRGARSAHHAPAGAYRCAGHDRWLALTVYDDADWARLAAIVPDLDRPEWNDGAQRRADHDEIDRHLSAWTAQLAPHAAMARLQKVGVAATAASTNADLVEDPQLSARGFMVAVDHPATGPYPYPGSPFLVDGRPLPISPAAPLGGDNEAILAELGFDAAHRAELAESGTIATGPPS